jgi:hypothetical protein
MPSLREVQQRAYRAILLEEDGLAASPVRLEVYRNNARETFRKTLAATYPVVERLVGDLCFRGLARSYMRDFPSRHGDLGRFGAELPTLLDIYYRDTPHAYLADVARLEWACAEVETAGESAALDLLELESVPNTRCAELRFSLRTSVRLLCSRFPVLSIWEANQGIDVVTVPLACGAEHVLVLRSRSGRVTLHRLDRGTYAFARSLADGEPLEDAVGVAEAADARFAVAAALEALARLDVLAGFHLPMADFD